MILLAMATERAPIGSWFNDNGTGAIYWPSQNFRDRVREKRDRELQTNTQHEHECERVGQAPRSISVAG
jgi:hypothetical protein